MQVLSDYDNFVYALEGDYSQRIADVWFSANKGQSFTALTLVNSQLPNGLYYNGALYACLGMRYLPVNGGLQKQIVMYGGSRSYGIVLNSTYYVQTLYMSLSGNATVSLSTTLSPSTSTYAASLLQVTLPSLSMGSASSSVLPSRQYGNCAVDIHHLSNGANVSMSLLGGSAGNWSSVFVSSNGYSTAYVNTDPSLSNSALPFAGRVAGASAYLSNGNLVWLAGKQYNASLSAGYSYSNNVYYSPDNAVTWYLSTSAAAFTPRSDTVTAAMPMTNDTITVWR